MPVVSLKDAFHGNFLAFPQDTLLPAVSKL